MFDVLELKKHQRSLRISGKQLVIFKEFPQNAAISHNGSVVISLEPEKEWTAQEPTSQEELMRLVDSLYVQTLLGDMLAFVASNKAMWKCEYVNQEDLYRLHVRFCRDIVTTMEEIISQGIFHHKRFVDLFFSKLNSLAVLTRRINQLSARTIKSHLHSLELRCAREWRHRFGLDKSKCTPDYTKYTMARVVLHDFVLEINSTVGQKGILRNEDDRRIKEERNGFLTNRLKDIKNSSF